MGNAGGARVEPIYRPKGELMFETAADNSSILSIDLGRLIGLLVLKRLLGPSLTRDRSLFGSTVASLLAIYALWRLHDTLPAFAFSPQNLSQDFLLCLQAPGLRSP